FTSCIAICDLVCHLKTHVSSILRLLFESGQSKYFGERSTDAGVPRWFFSGSSCPMRDPNLTVRYSEILGSYWNLFGGSLLCEPLGLWGIANHYECFHESR